VGVLTVLSFGAYVAIWFGLSWVELKRATEDERMAPFAHALSIFVPIYGIWQAFRHFTLIDTVRRKVDPARGVDALTGALGTGIWWLTFTHYSTEPIFVALDAIELVAGAAVVMYGQHALNAFWRSRPGPPATEGMTQLDWLALGVAASYALYTLLGVLAGPAS
jgi:hypothetical protein